MIVEELGFQKYFNPREESTRIQTFAVLYVILLLYMDFWKYTFMDILLDIWRTLYFSPTLN